MFLSGSLRVFNDSCQKNLKVFLLIKLLKELNNLPFLQEFVSATDLFCNIIS